MKIAVLLSGGVDSSVALRLLKEQGEHDITAFYLKIWLEDELSFLGDCPWEEDMTYVNAICEELDIPSATLSFHLKELKSAGLVRYERQGRSRIYSPDFAAMGKLIEFLTANCCAGSKGCGA